MLAISRIYPRLYFGASFKDYSFSTEKQLLLFMKNIYAQFAAREIIDHAALNGF